MGGVASALGGVAAALFSSLGIASMVGFLENGEAGKRTFLPVLLLSGMVATFQIAPMKSAPTLAVVFAVVFGGGWWVRRHRRSGR